MPIKLANNASARLAAPLAPTDTTVVLVMNDIQAFPALAAGEWHPLTVIASTGAFEIMRVMQRDANLLTVLRGQEGTTAIAFDATARAEVRLTAGTIEQMRLDTQNTANGYTDATAATLRSELNAAITNERSTSASEAATLTAAVGTKFDKAGGTVTGGVTVTGDITTYRPSSPGTGVVFFGNSGSRYLFYDGTNYNMPGAQLYVNGSPVWHAANFNPASYLSLAGGTMTGNYTIQNTSPQINFYDTDWGWRYLHNNGGLIGFLNNGGGWACYSQNDGTFIAAGNIGAYSDRKHKKKIKTIRRALELVEALRGVRYIDRRTGAARVGVIAQEVQEHLPEVVGEGPDGLHVDYGNIVGVLIPAIQELAAKVRALEGGL